MLMRMSLACLSLTAFLAVQDPGSPSEVGKEFRRHFAAVTKKGAELYKLTVITELRKAEARHFVLIRDSNGHDYLLSHVWDYSRQESLYELRDPGRKIFVRTTYAYPYKSRTREETLAEGKAHPELAKDLSLTIETPGTIRTAKESEWRDQEVAREWRSQIRESLDPDFLEALERMRGGLFHGEPTMDMFCSIVMQFVLHGADCENTDFLELHTAPPDCLFDASFGYACSDRQKERVANGESEKKLLDTY
jgi:hypothetical protein